MGISLAVDIPGGNFGAFNVAVTKFNGSAVIIHGVYTFQPPGGLLIQKPLFFDNYAGGNLYREFQTTDDIRTTDHRLDRIISLDKLFELLGIEASQEQAHPPLTYQNLLLTMWAVHCRGLSNALPARLAPR